MLESVRVHQLYNSPMKSNTNHIVIMAGGIDSWFWPMSTPEKPKQFIDVLGCGRTLIQLTADRFKGVCPLEHIWVVTSKSCGRLTDGYRRVISQV